jgi:hypothetical protein
VLRLSLLGGLVEPEITRRELARIWNDNQDPNEESGDAMARLYSAGFHAGMKWHAHLAEQGAAPAAEAQPAGGLVEKISKRIEFGIDANQDPEGIARAVLREAAAAARDAALTAAAKWLEQKANQ